MVDSSLFDVACDFRRSFRLLFMLSLLAIVVLVPSLLSINRASETYVITVVQVVTFGFLLLASGGLMVACARWGPTE